MTPQDRELLSQGAARELLERAGEIDAESTSVDTLRAAAREAGISEAAFDAALLEMRARRTNAAVLRPRRSRRQVLQVIGGMFLGILLFLVPVLILRAFTDAPEVAVHEFVVPCLPMQRAADIAHATLGRDAAVSWRNGARVMRVRSSPEDFQQLQTALTEAVKGAPSCEK